MTINNKNNFTVNDEYVEAEVYKETGEPLVWLVKVKFPEIKLYISGIRVQDSIKYPGELWAQPPAYKVGFRWIPAFECDKSGPFWKMVEYKACEAVIHYRDPSHVPPIKAIPKPNSDPRVAPPETDWRNIDFTNS
jgi:hypothetical protein